MYMLTIYMSKKEKQNKKETKQTKTTSKKNKQTNNQIKLIFVTKKITLKLTIADFCSSIHGILIFE